MKLKYYTIGVVFILILTSFSTVSSITIKKSEQTSFLQNSNNDNIKFSFSDEKFDATNLGLKGLELNLQTSSYDSVFSEKFDFNIKDCIVFEKEHGYYYLGIDGLKPYGSPGSPAMPMKTIVFEIPKNAEIIDLAVQNAYYKEFQTKLKITPMPEPIRFDDTESMEELYINNNVKPKVEIYSSTNFFPGNVIKYHTGKTNEKQIVIVQLFPLQYKPLEGKIILINEGELKLFYKNIDEPTPLLDSSSSVENIIITTPSLYNQAVELKNFHDSEGTLTQVVNTTWISLNYQKSDNPDFIGYKDISLEGRNQIKNYNYNLAKKIISYLDDQSQNSNLQFVTIFGSAKQVPPSYYFFDKSEELEDYPITWSWIPTDIFYSSPDLDMVPNYYIGRIPVKNSQEATKVVNKIKNWNASTDFFENTYLASGQSAKNDPVLSPFFMGELTLVDMINKDLFKGSNINKYFETDEEFNSQNLLDIFEKKSGLLYHLGHGNGLELDAGIGRLKPSDILGLQPNDKSPVVISLSCLNGAFDTELADISSSFLYDVKTSIGESVLLSDSAGICYIGSSRVCVSGFLPTFYKGNLEILTQAYFSLLVEYILDAYHNGADTLGNITTSALFDYQKNINTADHNDLLTFFEFTLLGDPALKLPERPSDGVSYEKSNSTIEDPIGFIPPNQNISYPIVAYNEKINITSKTDAPSVEIKIIDTSRNSNYTIERQEHTADGISVRYNFTPDSSNYFLIRTITPDGKEGWMYIQAARIVDDDYDSSTPGFGKTRWASIQDAIDFYNQDTEKKSSGLIYVLNGTYKENLNISSNLGIMGENKKTTIIDGQEKGNVIEVTDCSFEIFGFTIKNSGKEETDAAISVQPGYCSLYVINNIIDNNNIGIDIDRNAEGMISISYNTITNNTYGIKQNAKRFLYSSTLMFIDSNIIKDNKYGIYMKKSGYFSIVGIPIFNMIFYNVFSNNTIGLFLNDCKRNLIAMNNFVDNSIQSIFFRSKKNWYVINYWDNWRGISFGGVALTPKIIFGTRGIFGLLPLPALDIVPSPVPIEYLNPYE